MVHHPHYCLLTTGHQCLHVLYPVQADAGPAGLRAATELLERRGLTELPHVLSLPVHDRCVGRRVSVPAQAAAFAGMLLLLLLLLQLHWLRSLSHLSCGGCRTHPLRFPPGRRRWCAMRCGRSARATTATRASS